MHFRTAQFFRRHFFIGDGFHNIGAGHEHVGSVADHENEIGNGRRIHIAPAHGPIIMVIWGITPEASVLR